MDTKKDWSEETFEGRWTRDSETAEYVLIDLKTNKEVMRTKEKPC